MGGRYIITGTQLGILKATCKSNHAQAEINRIIEHQFIYNSDSKTNSVYNEILNIRKIISRSEDDLK